MDLSTIGIIVAAVAIIAYFIFRGRKPAAQGTYDDRKVSSSGSIGGGPRAHDDPKVSSSGSIGGGPRAHDSREVASGGSIGRQSTENNRRRDARGEPVRDEDDKATDHENDDRPTHNDPKLRSGGSFGSS